MNRLWLAAALVMTSVGCKKVSYNDVQPPPGQAPAASQEALGSDVANESAQQDDSAPGEVELTPAQQAFQDEWEARLPTGDNIEVLDIGTGEVFTLAYAFEAVQLQRVVTVDFIDGVRATREMVFAPDPDGNHHFVIEASTPQSNDTQEPFHDYSRSEFAFRLGVNILPNGRVLAADLVNGEFIQPGASSEALIAWVQQMVILFPIKDIGIGAQWKAQIPNPLSPSDSVEVTYTLVELSPNDAEISVTSAPFNSNGKSAQLHGRRLVSPLHPMAAGDITTEPATPGYGLRVLWDNDEDEQN